VYSIKDISVIIEDVSDGNSWKNGRMRNEKKRGQLTV
jgi:hypothetical protein